MQKGHTPITVTLGGKTHDIQVPKSFAEREDIRDGWTTKNPAKSRRIFAATLAACLPDVAALTKASRDDFEDLYGYGKEVYDALRSSGLTPVEITVAATDCFRAVMASLFPRRDAVEEREDFSKGEATAT